MKKHLPKLILVLLTAGLVSCVTNKKLTYLQYSGTPPDTIAAVTPSNYKVLPFDNLFIRVVTPDPKWSEMFNTLPTTTYSVSVTEQSADLISYPVDGSGAILLPYAGKIVVAGKTLSVITTELETALKGYIADAAVTVKMINNYVSLLGEVTRPGRYPIYKDRLNIFQALAMGGDLSEYSNRQKVQVIRQTQGGNTIKEFSLTDRSIMSSEFFYVMPNDVIYAMPMKGKFFQMSAFPYSVLLSTITTFILMWNVLKL
jgi:polysaccharide export outer membrane protein